MIRKALVLRFKTREGRHTYCRTTENPYSVDGRCLRWTAIRQKHKRLNKSSIKTIDFNIVAFQYFEGVDLLEIPGVSYGTLLSIMSEVGPNGLDNFPTAKHFTSWLRLAPNNKISGGRRTSSKMPKGSHGLKVAFLNAAYSLARLKILHKNKFL